MLIGLLGVLAGIGISMYSLFQGMSSKVVTDYTFYTGCILILAGLIYSIGSLFK